MATFIGFSTQDVYQQRNLDRPGVDGGMGNIVHKPKLTKKFRLTDKQLVVRDLLNAFSIKQGDKVGQPAYGTNLWSYVFDPNTADLREQVESEVRRIIAGDPRIALNDIAVYFNDHGILLEVQVFFRDSNDVAELGFFLDRATGSVQQLDQ